MPWSVRVQKEDGTPLVAEDLVLPFYIVEGFAGDLVMLRSLDRNDDTIFNGAQVRELLKEWDTLLSRHEGAVEVEICRAVHRYLQYCIEAPFRYVKFIGD